MPDIEIFKSGTHFNGKHYSFSDADIEGIASSYNSKLHQAPIVLGHPTDNAPAYGWVNNLSASNGRLVADVELCDNFKEAVNDGHYKKVSASFYDPKSPANPTPNIWHLRHVGFLGATPPAIKGLAPAQFAGGVDDYITFGDEEVAWSLHDIGRILTSMREFLIEKFGRDKANEAIPDTNLEGLKNDAKSNLDDVLGDGIKPTLFTEQQLNHESEDNMPDTNFSEQKEALQKQQQALEAREHAIAARENAERVAEALSFAENLVVQGKVLPAQKDAVLRLHQHLAEAQAANFSDAGDEPLAAFKSFCDALPNQVEFKELSKQSTVADFSDGYDLAEKAAAYMAEKGQQGISVTSADAVNYVKKQGV